MKKCYSVLLAAAVLMSAGCSTLDDLNPFSGKTKAKVGKLAELPLKVTLFSIGLLDSLYIPPPQPVAWLPLKVTLVSVGLLAPE